jgi:hypothetical protein
LRRLGTGFEEALRQTKHKNTTGRMPSASGYLLPPPCCQVERAREFQDLRAFRCKPHAPLEGGTPLPAAPPDTFAWEER